MAKKLKHYRDVWGYFDMRRTGKTLIKGDQFFWATSGMYAKRRALELAEPYTKEFPYQQREWSTPLSTERIIAQKHFYKTKHTYKGFAFVRVMKG